MQKGIIDPVVNYFNAHPNATSDELVGVLRQVKVNAAGLVLSIVPEFVGGGTLTSANGDEVRFDLRLQASRTRTDPDQAGDGPGAAWREAWGERDDHTDGELLDGFVVRVQPDAGLIGGRRVLHPRDALDASVKVEASDVNIDATFGFLNIPVRHGKIVVEADVTPPNSSTRRRRAGEHYAE